MPTGLHYAPKASPRILALPGMGADGRMYPQTWDTVPGLVRCEWPRHQGERSLGDIADTLIRTHSISPVDLLVGCSLGGMVACEIARKLQLRRIVLVGSALHPSEVSALLRTLHPLARYAPIDWIRVSAGKVPAEVAQMFTGIEASFVRAMCEAIFEWPGFREHPATEVYRIHGSRDLVIPPPPGPVDLLIDGGHLISMTHAGQCADFVRRTLASR